MAGTYTQPPYVMPQPWHQPAMNPAKGRASLHAYSPGRGWTQAVGAPIPGELAGLGLVTVDPELTLESYAAGSLIGSTIGGAMVGFVVAADSKGATTGALFTGGLAALSDAVLFARTRKPVPAMVMGVAGLAGMGAALYRMSRKMGGGGLRARR